MWALTLPTVATVVDTMGNWYEKDRCLEVKDVEAILAIVERIMIGVDARCCREGNVIGKGGQKRPTCFDEE